jgi:hypothetical protein
MGVVINPMPEIDYELLSDLLGVLGYGGPVPLDRLRRDLLRRGWEHPRPPGERAADFNRRIWDLVANLRPLYDITIVDGAIQWHQPQAPATDQLLVLNEGQRQTMAAVGDAVTWLADGAEPGDDDVLGFGKVHVPRDTIRFWYGNAPEAIQGRAARLDLDPPPRLILDRDGVYERYRVDAIWDLDVLAKSHGEFAEVSLDARTIEPTGPRPQHKRFYAGRGRGRPTATEMFRAMKRLAPLITLRSSNVESDPDGTRRLPVRVAEEALGVPARRIETWAHILGAVIDGDDIVVDAGTPTMLTGTSQIDVVVGTELLVILRALDRLSDVWARILNLSVSNVQDLDAVLTTFLPHIQLMPPMPTPTSNAILDARCRLGLIDLRIDNGPAIRNVTITGIVMRGRTWLVIGRNNEAAFEEPLEALSVTGPASL